MPTATTPSKGSTLEDLRSRRSDLHQEIERLIGERDSLHREFEARMTGEGAPSEDEVTRFEARRNHSDENIRPTEQEVREFESRLHSGPSDEEIRQFNEQHEGRKGDVRSKMTQLIELGERIEEQTRLGHSLDLAHQASRGTEYSQLSRQRDAITYRQDNQNSCSYFLDLAAMQNMEVRSTPDPRLEGFRERLDKHAKEMADILPQRWAQRKAVAEARVESAEREFRGRYGVQGPDLEVSPFERQAHMRSLAPPSNPESMELRAPSRIVGQGGYAIPPLWLSSN